MCQAQGSPRVVLGLSRDLAFSTATERSIESLRRDRPTRERWGRSNLRVRIDPRVLGRRIHRSWGFHRPYQRLACQNHSFHRHPLDPVFHLLTCLELYEGVLGLPATLIPLNEQRQVVCQAQGSLRVVLGLSRCSVLFTATER